MDINRWVKFFLAFSLWIPVVLVPSLFVFPYIVPKVLLFRAIVCVMVGLFFLLWYVQRKKVWTGWTPITAAVVIFLVSASLSTLFGVDVHRSFWDGHERMLGVFTLIHFVAYYFVATAVLSTKKDWQQLLWLGIISANFVVVISFLQKVWPDFLFNHGLGRPVSTLGNPIYVAGCGIFLLFLSLFQAMRAQGSTWLRVLLFMSAGIGFFGILLSGTRGALVGVVTAIFGLCVWYGFFSRHITLKRRARATFLVGTLMISLLILFRQTTFVMSIPSVGHLVNTSISGGTSATRLMAWGIAVESWRERPIFGWGPNNFLYAFNLHYRPEFLEHGWNETWFDNAHSSVLNTLATQGMVGAVAYVGLFVAAFWSLFLAWRSNVFEEHEAVFLAAYVVAHLVQSLFVFEYPTSWLYLFFLLAFINSQYLSIRFRPIDVVRWYELPRVVVGGVVVAVLLFLYASNINPARANMTTFKALKKMAVLEDPTQLFQQALRIRTPHYSDIRSEFARMAIDASAQYSRQGKLDISKRVLLESYEELEKNIAEHPMDTRYYLQQVEVMERLASLHNRVDLLVEAEKKLDTAILLSPKRQQTLYMLALMQLQLNKNQQAIDTLRQVLADNPKIGESWWRLALMYQSQRRLADAQAVVREAQKSGVRFDERGKNIMKSILPLESLPVTL